MSMSKNILISLDLDGTLLNDKKNISFITKNYLKKLQKQGYIITFSTGRSFRNVKRYVEELNIENLLVLNNGCTIYNPQTNEKIIHGIKLESLKESVKLITSFFDGFIVETFDSIYYDDTRYFDFAFENIENIKLIQGDYSIVNDINDEPLTFLGRLKKDANKEELINILQPFLKDFDIRFWWGAPYFEIVAKNVSKARGIQILATKYNITEENIIVFGDAENDLEMLETFKNSFLMKNGNKELVKYATYVTKKDNNHNGIYHSLRQILKFIK